jgi:16S rRNA (cytidine1402-2'-O)-methyltransferase
VSFQELVGGQPSDDALDPGLLLAAVDLIAAEDTRRTGRLLAHLQLVDRPLLSFFEGNERERTEEVLRRLREVDLVVTGSAD